jgi:hypothetical protein
MNMNWAVGLAAVVLGVGCAPDWGDRVPKPKARGHLSLEPPLVANVSSRAVEVLTSLGSTPRLFALALSDAQIKSVRRGEASKTVLQREIKLHEAGDPPRGAHGQITRWRSGGLLSAATSYTAVTEDGYLKFMTAANEPVLVRAWPSGAPDRRAVFCAEAPIGLGALPANPERLWGNDRVWFIAGDAGFTAGEAGLTEADKGLSAAQAGSTDVDAGLAKTDARFTTANTAVAATISDDSAPTWTLLAGEASCFLWQGVDGVEPPRQWNGFVIERATAPQRGDSRRDAGVTAIDRQAVEPCRGDELPIEHGCVQVQDDRIIVRPTTADTLWFVTGAAQGWFVSEQGEPGVIRGLLPNAEAALDVFVFESSGVNTRAALEVHTQAVNYHVVINEVFPDPHGPEPQGEWIEVYNDSANVAQLGDMALEDEGGKVELPPVQLAPFGYALLVNDTYERTAELDVVPDEDVFLIRLPTLGKSGLANQGETLRLVHNSGMVVSTFPASPKPKAGVSVARREPWFVGNQARGFGLHAAPFASPGKRNELGSHD